MNKKTCLVLIAVAAAALPAACRKAPEAEKTAAAAAAETAAPAGAAVDVEGTYGGGGTDPDGQAYDCDVKFIPARQVYWVERFIDGRPMAPGVGIRRGDTFVVGYRDDRDRYGVVAYHIKPDGSLEGTSAQQDSVKVGLEVLKKK